MKCLASTKLHHQFFIKAYKQRTCFAFNKKKGLGLKFIGAAVGAEAQLVLRLLRVEELFKMQGLDI